MYDFGNQMKAGELSVVEKALFKPPTLNQALQPKKPSVPKAPSAPRLAKPLKPRVKQTGVGSSVNKMYSPPGMLIEKRATKEQKQGAALIGTSGVAGSAAIMHNRIGNTANNLKRRAYDARISRFDSGTYGLNTSGRKVADPRSALPKDSAGRTVYSSPEQKRAMKKTAAASVKRKHQKLHALKTARAKPMVSGSGRSKILLGGTAVAVPSLWAGSRKLVEKRYLPQNKSETDAAILGAAAGAGGYQGAGYALKPLDRRAERKIAQDPDLQARAKEYQKTSGRNPKAKAGDPSWRNYFRNYPKDLPGGRLKRAMAVGTTGKSGVALTGLAGTAGAATAVKGVRDYRRRKSGVAKSMPDQSAINVMGNAKVLRPRKRGKGPLVPRKPGE